MLHLDWTDYAETLLGPADWTDAASIAALYGKAQQLLPSDLIVLPLGRIAAAHIAARAGLHSAVASKPGGAQPLRALLGDAALREMVASLLTRTQPALAGAALALGVPAPVAFARDTAVAAGLPAPAASDDLADDAAVYLADFLRVFAATPLGALVLGQSAYPEFDAPVLKVAAHYNWRMLRTPTVIPAQAGTHLQQQEMGPGLRRDDGEESDGIVWATIPAGTRPEDAAALAQRLRDPA